VRTETVTTVVPAPRKEVFSWLSDIESLPEWATEFARELKVEDGRYKVVNGLGEFLFEIDADERTGVIDMYAGPDDEHMALFPARVVGLPSGETAFTFTMLQGPDQPDALFESQYLSLRREFENIERRFGAGGPGPSAPTAR
jgi:hypothetical protein